MSEIKFLPPDKSGLEEIIDLLEVYFHNLFDDFALYEHGTKRAVIESRLKRACETTWGLYDEKELIGVVWLENNLINESGLFSTELFTCFKKRAWGMKVTKACHKFMTAVFKELQPKKVIVSTFSNNKLPKKRLEMVGFKKIAEIPDETLVAGELTGIKIYELTK